MVFRLAPRIPVLLDVAEFVGRGDLSWSYVYHQLVYRLADAWGRGDPVHIRALS